MYIKHLFDDLNVIGEKKYFQKNEEEELYFENTNISVNIYKVGTHISINLSVNGKIENYSNSCLLSIDEKQSINAYLMAHVVTSWSCAEVSRILLQALARHNIIDNKKNK